MEEEMDKAEDETLMETDQDIVKIHPLLIPHIVDKVLGYLSPATSLLPYRLISKQWAYSSSHLLRKTLSLRIGSYATTPTKFKELLDLYSHPSFDLDLSPFANFSLCQDLFQPQYEPLLLKFFHIFSPVINSLAIWLDVKTTMDFSPNSSLFKSPIVLRNLTKLEIDDQRPYFHKNYQDVYQELEEPQLNLQNGSLNLLNFLLTSSPSLEQLNIHYETHTDPLGQGQGSPHISNINSVLSTILSSESNFNTIRNLLSLKLSLNFDPCLISTLTGVFPHSRLRHLDLNLKGSDMSPDAFYNLLSSPSKLEGLKLSFGTLRTPFLLKFPKMSQLTSLQLQGWDRTFDLVQICDFSYKLLPCVRILKIDSFRNSEDWWQLFKSSLPVYSLKELKLPEEVVGLESMRGIVKMFPNLRKLDLRLDLEDVVGGVLQLIFHNLGMLTDLKVRRKTSGWDRERARIDYILTGIPKEYCEAIGNCRCLKGHNKGSGDVEIYGENLKELRKAPGLTNLKNLRRLEMSDLQYMAEVTDVTGYLAFLQMDKLEYLDVGRSMMSDACLSKLAKRFPQNMEEQLTLPRLRSKVVETNEPFLDFPGRCSFL